METPLTQSSAVQAAFRGLVDYAGLFPPAKLELTEASDEYRTARGEPFAWMLGGFIVPLSLLAERRDALRDAPLCVILDVAFEPADLPEQVSAAAAEVAALRDDGLQVQVLEVPLGAAFARLDAAIAALRDLRKALDGQGVGAVRTYVELPRDARWTELLDAAMPHMSTLQLRAKLRCGGVTPGAFPTPDEVAAFLAATCAANVPFKATAGLHHPIRHRDETTGFHMHGFLNLLTAAALAPNVDRVTLREAIEEEDPGAFAFDRDSLHWRARHIAAKALAQTRVERFVSYGSCSFAEPVDDLIALGILAP